MSRLSALRAPALALVALLAVAACGTSETAQTTPTPTPPPPGTPPPPPAFSVVSTSPANGQTEVGLGTPLVVRFNAPVNNQPGDGRNPCVAGIVVSPAPVAPPTSCTVVGDTVTWAGWVLRGTTTYTITIPAQVGAADGRILGSNYTFSFTTRTGQLTNAVLPIVPGSVGWACAPDNLGAVVGPAAWVGDNEAGLAGPPACGGGPGIPRFRGFVAFGLLGQMLSPPAAIQNATLTVSIATLIGNMFDVFLGGGPIRVTRVDYLDNGVLDQADYAQGPVGQLLNVFDSSNFVAPASVDVTGMVQNAVGTPPTSVPGQQPYVGFRFQWGTAAGLTENTDGLFDTDAALLGGFVLQVTFWH